MSGVRAETHLAVASCRRLVLARGEKRNSLARDVITSLTEELERAAADKSVKVVLLEGEGPAFCSGHDLKELTAHRTDADGGAAFYRETMLACSDMMKTIVRLPKPVVARVHGVATAAGCQLVASCDLAIAGESAWFMTPGVNLGLFCSTPMVALGRNLSRKHTMQMLLLGEQVDATKAAELGLVNESVADDELDTAILRYLEILAAKPPYTVAIGKEAFYKQLEMNLDDAYNYVSEVMVTNMLSGDAKEGIGAFLEKRTPVWPED